MYSRADSVTKESKGKNSSLIERLNKIQENPDGLI